MLEEMKRTLLLHVDFYAGEMNRTSKMECLHEHWGSMSALLRFAYVKGILTEKEYYTTLSERSVLFVRNIRRIKNTASC